jgi:hypothetical protein
MYFHGAVFFELFEKWVTCPHVSSLDIKHQMNPPIRIDFYEDISRMVLVEVSTVIPRLTSDPANEFFG